jgi:polyhydroxyalkanoate synthase
MAAAGEDGGAGPPAAVAGRGRRGPRPLALHLLHAQLAWTREPTQLARFLAGLQRYWAHPYRRALPAPPTVWRCGASRLLDYRPAGGPPVLVIPSLVNRAEVLDLAPGRSLLRHLAAAGLRPLLLDWGRPGATERRLDLAGHILARAGGALDHALALTGARPALLGYCMGGLLALGLAACRPDAVAGLALLATPWDFHAGAWPAALLDGLGRALALAAGGLGGLPVDVLQACFAALDPLQVPRKFAAFAGLDPASPEAEAFVALEDWLNDGVPLGAALAQDCLVGWHAENRPARGLWALDGRLVRPEALALPCLAALPAADRIVPPAAAAALAARLPQAQILRPRSGHIGMVVGRRAPAELWAPLAAWLAGLAAPQKTLGAAGALPLSSYASG